MASEVIKGPPGVNETVYPAGALTIMESPALRSYPFWCVRHVHYAIGCKSRTGVVVLTVSQEQGCRGRLRI